MTRANNAGPYSDANGRWKVDTFNVGQADAHRLVIPDGECVLFDADEEMIADQLNNETIDHLLITHLHYDHIGGIRGLREAGCQVQQSHQPTAVRYDIEAGDIRAFTLDKYHKGLQSHGITSHDINHISTGEVILDKEDATLTVLSPPATTETIETTSQSTGYPCEFQPKKANPNGAVCKFEGPDGVLGLFMGDVGDESAHNAESWLCEQYADPESDVNLDADILYLGHHGSNKSTGETFLDSVDPEHVVISSSLDNNYTSENQYDGHPHDETLKRLHDREIDVHWTAVHGTTTTSVENGSVHFDHDNPVETTAAADIAVLKYYGRNNDLDKKAIAEIEEITLDALPEQTPEWAKAAPLVAGPHEIDPERIDELHALEVEQGKLKREKHRLEATREQRIEQKAALKADSGLSDRLTAAVNFLWGTTESGETEHATEQDEERTESEQAETDAQGYEAIEAAIDAYEQRNNGLKSDVETLTKQADTLEQEIERLNTGLTKREGLFERLQKAVGRRTNAQSSAVRDESTNTPTAGTGHDAASTVNASKPTTEQDRTESESTVPEWIKNPDVEPPPVDPERYETVFGKPMPEHLREKKTIRTDRTKRDNERENTERTELKRDDGFSL